MFEASENLKGCVILVPQPFMFAHLPDPGSFFPEVFEGAVAVRAEPPATCCPLYDEYRNADEDASCDAHLKVKAPVIVEEGADDALSDVVGHAHAPVWNQ